MQLLCTAAADCRVHRIFELLKLLIRHEREDRPGKAAAVDANGSFAAKQLPAQHQCEGHLLMGCCAKRRDVLQELP